MISVMPTFILGLWMAYTPFAMEDDMDWVHQVNNVVTELMPTLPPLTGGDELSNHQVLPANDRVSDETRKVILRDQKRRPRLFLLMTEAGDRDLVLKHASTAINTRELLGEQLGESVLTPLHHDQKNGWRFAVYDYCKPLPDSNWGRRFHAFRTLPRVADWLHDVVQSTKKPAPLDQVRKRLVAISKFQGLSRQSAQHAMHALDRLESGDWNPSSSFSHDDLWRSNILHHSRFNPEKYGGNRRFVVIDWPGARLDGYPFYDLLRIHHSFSKPGRRFRNDITKHCQILDCSTDDIFSYTLTALGKHALDLRNFPRERFIRTVESLRVYLGGVINGC